MPNSSSSAAKVPGTGSPEMARCASVRLVEKPRAPATTASRTMAAIASMSAGVAGSLLAPRSPMTYARTAPWGTWVPTSSTNDRRSRASRNSGKVSHSHTRPSLRAAPGMSSTPSISPINQSCRSGAAGANPTPQLPMTSVVTPCQHDGDSCGSHVACPS